MKSIYERRSIRRYREQAIDSDILKHLVKAGMNAPSAYHQYPWEFIVVTDSDLLVTLSEQKETAHMLSKAAAAIVVLGTETNLYWQHDLAACTENILLEATDHGLGSCWIGVYPDLEGEAKYRSLLQVPSSLHVFSLIALGYPEQAKPANDHYWPERIYDQNYGVPLTK